MPPSLEIDCVTAGHAISEHFAIQTLVGTREPMFASPVARKWLVAFVSLLRRYLWSISCSAIFMQPCEKGSALAHVRRFADMSQVWE